MHGYVRYEWKENRLGWWLGGIEGRMVVEGAHGDRYVAREACHRIGGEEQVRVRRY